MLAEFTAWLLSLVKEFIGALWDFLTDLFVSLIDLLVSALVALVSAIPVPEFLSQGLQGVYGQLDPAISYLLAASGIPAALAIVGAGYTFRLLRKFATLFQW